MGNWVQALDGERVFRVRKRPKTVTDHFHSKYEYFLRSSDSPGGRVNKNLFTRLLIRAFSDVEKLFYIF